MDKINDGSALNLSTGKLTSFIDFASQTCTVLGYNPEIRATESKPEGVFSRGGDTEKQKKFGFNYDTKLIDGIKKTINYLSNKN